MDALNTGTVELIDDCLVLVNDGIEPAVLVWSHGTSWNEADGTVDLPGSSREVRIGDHISAGGGGGRPDQMLDRYVTDPEALVQIRRCLEAVSSDAVVIITGTVRTSKPQERRAQTTSVPTSPQARAGMALLRNAVR
jgi:hypothetical protein